jgi:hypothetical protein
LAFAVLAFANGGCLVAAAGAAAGGAAAGYAYYKGKINQHYAASLDDTLAATRTALGELEMPILREEREPDSGFIEARTRDGERVRVYLDRYASPIPAEGMLTRVAVRLATFGDEAASERILNQIGAHLVADPTIRPATALPSTSNQVRPSGWAAPSSSSGVQPASVTPQTMEPPLLPVKPRS